MNKILIFFFSILILPAASTHVEAEATKKNPVLQTTSQKFSYTMGKDVITALKKLDTKIDFDAFVLGAQDCYQNKPSKLSEQQIAEVKKEISESVKEKQKDKIAEISAKNLKEGEAFLQNNRKKEGVIVTQSGLQYQIIKEGTGVFPKDDDEVVVHYKGLLIDGKEFDSSYKRGGPTKVRVKEVLPGWAEGLKKIKAGGQVRFFLPPHLAYGPRYSGAGGIIGPNSTVIFEVELIELVVPEKTKQ